MTLAEWHETAEWLRETVVALGGYRNPLEGMPDVGTTWASSALGQRAGESLSRLGRHLNRWDCVTGPPVTVTVTGSHGRSAQFLVGPSSIERVLDEHPETVLDVFHTPDPYAWFFDLVGSLCREARKRRWKDVPWQRFAAIAALMGESGAQTGATLIDWADSPMPASECADAVRLGVRQPKGLSDLLSAGLPTITALEQWKDQGMSSTVALRWLRAGVRSPERAAAWRAAEKSATVASNWARVGVVTAAHLQALEAAGVKSQRDARRHPELVESTRPPADPGAG